MLLHKGQDFREFIKNETQSVHHSRDFSKTIENDYILRPNTRRGVLVTGLRSTGKTTGVYQAVQRFPSDSIIHIAPTSRSEEITQETVIDILQSYKADLIFIDEYSWIKNEKNDDILADYLIGKAQEGVKVIVTGTDSAKINSLLNTTFIHRAVQVNTTYFSYDEYCRLYELEKNDASMKEFLIKGGIFENHIYKNFGSMRDYVKSAIVENLASYYPQHPKELIEATVYKIFYECISKNYIKSENVPVYNRDGNRLAYEDFLENFGIRTDIEIKRNVLNEMFSKLEEIGVLVVLSDIKLEGRKRAYITNQSISAQLTKCIYELDELPETYLGDLYEATVVCHEYMQYAYDESPYDIFYAENRKSTCEVDFILCDKRKAYLFDCKLNDNNSIRINDTASIVKDEVENMLGDRDLAGRYVIYQGEEKVVQANNRDVVCTNNWDIDFEKFHEHVKRLQVPHSLLPSMEATRESTLQEINSFNN